MYNNNKNNNLKRSYLKSSNNEEYINIINIIIKRGLIWLISQSE